MDFVACNFRASFVFHYIVEVAGGVLAVSVCMIDDQRMLSGFSFYV